MSRRVNGDTVRVLRESLGISQAALAIRAGVSASQLSKVEHGANSASPELARKLADGLEVPLVAITYPVADEPAVASS